MNDELKHKVKNLIDHFRGIVNCEFGGDWSDIFANLGKMCDDVENAMKDDNVLFGTREEYDKPCYDNPLIKEGNKHNEEI